MDKFNALKLVIDEEVRKAMEERGIHEEELKDVIGTAEETGVKLRNETGTLFLAKRKIGEIYFYAVYEAAGKGFNVLDAYLHATDVTGW